MKSPFRGDLMPRDIVSSDRSLKCVLTLIPCKHEEPQCLLVPALLLSLHALGTIPYDWILWIDRICQDPSRWRAQVPRFNTSTNCLTHVSHGRRLRGLLRQSAPALCRRPPARRQPAQACVYSMPSRSAIRVGPVGFQFSFCCVSAPEAGISCPAKWASQPKCASASSGLMLTTGIFSPLPSASAMAFIDTPSSSTAC